MNNGPIWCQFVANWEDISEKRSQQARREHWYWSFWNAEKNFPSNRMPSPVVLGAVLSNYCLPAVFLLHQYFTKCLTIEDAVLAHDETPMQEQFVLALSKTNHFAKHEQFKKHWMNSLHYRLERVADSIFQSSKHRNSRWDHPLFWLARLSSDCSICRSRRYLRPSFDGTNRQNARHEHGPNWTWLPEDNRVVQSW